VSAPGFGNGVERIRCGQRAGHALIYTFPYGNMSSVGDCSLTCHVWASSLVS
jgi:hypothetical protein